MRSRGWFWGRGHGRRRHRHRRHRRHALSLADLREGEAGILESLDLPGEVAHRLMELGFLPGSEVVAAKTAPGGDPQVFRIDGSEIALRRETAQHLILKPTP
jgi:ferrous iron transport protein A